VATIIFTFKSLKPGKTNTVYWNNTTYGAVYEATAWARPLESLKGITEAADSYNYGAEVVRIWTECTLAGSASNLVGPTRVGITVKNTGKRTAHVDVVLHRHK
jgi:hypothetical protein